MFHARHDFDKHSQLAANLDDILQAFDALDLSDSIPPICCEASQLHKFPVLSLDPAEEQVCSNSQAVKACSLLLRVSKRSSQAFLQLVSPQWLLVVLSQVSVMLQQPPPSLLLRSLYSDLTQEFFFTEALFCSSCNLILFSLPEGRSLVESKKVVEKFYNLSY